MSKVILPKGSCCIVNLDEWLNEPDASDALKENYLNQNLNKSAYYNQQFYKQPQQHQHYYQSQPAFQQQQHGVTFTKLCQI